MRSHGGHDPAAHDPADHDPAAVRIREAATVVLVRDSPSGSGLEVFLQHRVDTMVFAPGMSVFPGGGVEEVDRDPAGPWDGPDPRWWAERFRVDEARAAAGVRAVLRELWEETGLVLPAARLRPWDRWTTPVGPPRRYDTLFFLAVLDRAEPGPGGTTSEARWSGWADARTAVADAAAGRFGMLRPTLTVLRGLADVDRAADLPEEGRAVPEGGR